MQIKNKDAMDPASWCGLNKPELSEKDVDAVIFGIPFEGGIAYRGGTSEAPDVLRANTKLATPCTEELAYYKDFTVLDAGNFAMAEGGDPVGQGREDLFKEVQDYVESLVRQGTRFTMIGGDHSVTIPMLRGVDAALDDPEDTFGIVYIDAHMDLSYAMGGDLKGEMPLWVKPALPISRGRRTSSTSASGPSRRTNSSSNRTSRRKARPYRSAPPATATSRASRPLRKSVSPP